VPPLRERSEDIPDLAELILRRLSRRMNVPAPNLDAAALAALQSYAFPGNVRELENILERALTLCTGDLISAEQLRVRADARAGSDSTPIAAAASGALGAQLEDIEREAIVKALEKTRYNKTAAAKLLGMSFRALRYRVKKLGIE